MFLSCCLGRVSYHVAAVRYGGLPRCGYEMGCRGKPSPLLRERIGGRAPFPALISGPKRRSSGKQEAEAKVKHRRDARTKAARQSSPIYTFTASLVLLLFLPILYSHTPPSHPMASSSTLAFDHRPRQLFIGSLVSPKALRELTLINNGLLGVDEDGKIVFVEDLDAHSDQPTAKHPSLALTDEDEGARTPSASDAALSALSRQQRSAVLLRLAAHGWDLTDCQLTILRYGEFLCPGFIDTHTHACQGEHIGSGVVQCWDHLADHSSPSSSLLMALTSSQCRCWPAVRASRLAEQHHLPQGKAIR